MSASQLKFSNCLTLAALVALLSSALVFAADDAADPQAAGRKLVSDAKCEACHIGKVGGNGSAIYTRKDRRVTTKSKLLPQVQRCSTELNLALFPEDEAAIVDYLNATYYKFKD